MIIGHLCLRHLQMGRVQGQQKQRKKTPPLNFISTTFAAEGLGLGTLFLSPSCFRGSWRSQSQEGNAVSSDLGGKAEGWVSVSTRDIVCWFRSIACLLGVAKKHILWFLFVEVLHVSHLPPKDPSFPPNDAAGKSFHFYSNIFLKKIEFHPSPGYRQLEEVAF